MLYLVGLGIWDEKDMSLKGLEACRKSSRVYAELYTSAWGGNLKNLEKLTGKKIKVIGRSDLEERSSRLVKEAKTKNISILVPGDPLSATTHSSIMDEAMKRKVKLEVIHSSSVFTSIAETGLSLYNFGKTVTVARPAKGYRPESYYDIIKENLDKGMHTLALLDIEMSVQEGLGVLMDLERKKGKGVLKPRKKLVVASAMGSPKKVIRHGTVLKLAEDDFPPPAVIIIPGILNFFEKEFLEKL